MGFYQIFLDFLSWFLDLGLQADSFFYEDKILWILVDKGCFKEFSQQFWLVSELSGSKLKTT